MKNSILGIITFGIIIAAGVVFIGNDDNTMTSPAEDMTSTSNQSVPENTVIIDDLAFMTEELTIKKGTTVTWVNQDTARHNINFTDASMDSADSELFGQGESYEYTFDEVGSFDYTCTPHPFMKATVTVTE